MDKHLSLDEMFLYVNTTEIHEENVDKIYELDCHLLKCEECFKKVKLLKNINYLIDNWSPELENLMYSQELEKSTSLYNRLNNWFQKYKCKSSAAMEILINKKENFMGDENYITKIITEGMEKFIAPVSKYNFNSSLSLSTRGRREKARGFGTKAMDKNTGSFVIVDSSDMKNNKVLIEFENLTSDYIPLIMLINIEDTNTLPYIKMPQKREEGKYEAEFSHLNSGRYILLLEPQNN